VYVILILTELSVKKVAREMLNRKVGRDSCIFHHLKLLMTKRSSAVFRVDMFPYNMYTNGNSSARSISDMLTCVIKQRAFVNASSVVSSEAYSSTWLITAERHRMAMGSVWLNKRRLVTQLIVLQIANI